MYFLPENSKRRENVIAGLTAALVGLAMIAIAGKASATDPSVAHDHTTANATTVNGPVEDDKKDIAAPAANSPGSHSNHALHQGHQGEAMPQQSHDHSEHSKEADE